MDINKYINYRIIFCDLIKQHEEELLEEMEQMNTYGEIARFAAFNNFQKWSILKDECDIHESLIIFCFGIDFNDANESNTQSSSADVTIVYNRHEETFLSYSYNQG